MPVTNCCNSALCKKNNKLVQEMSLLGQTMVSRLWRRADDDDDDDGPIQSGNITAVLEQGSVIVIDRRILCRWYPECGVFMQLCGCGCRRTLHCNGREIRYWKPVDCTVVRNRRAVKLFR